MKTSKLGNSLDMLIPGSTSEAVYNEFISNGNKGDKILSIVEMEHELQDRLKSIDKLILDLRAKESELDIRLSNYKSDVDLLGPDYKYHMMMIECLKSDIKDCGYDISTLNTKKLKVMNNIDKLYYLIQAEVCKVESKQKQYLGK